MEVWMLILKTGREEKLIQICLLHFIYPLPTWNVSHKPYPPPCQGRTAKALRSLQFANPGKQTEFAPETGKREKRRLTKNAPAGSDRQVIPAKSKVYDSQGLLIFSGMDLCDCLDEDCLGCFYACPACGSTKCGAECRCDRKWLYEQIEIEGGEIIHNKHAG
ncbi:ARL14 effector protein isoform X2 [Vicugna pacos]|uniref:ARL14 effector protein isoform X2 n=1 Tax=Vicugna pacos TaxID=30538 RepID=A0ABM5DY38_VICPA